MTKLRARDLGIPFEGQPGPYNSITDVQGVTVGYATIIEGDSARTGVTIIHPRGRDNHELVFAGYSPFNGNGEMTGSDWVDEGGFLEGPIGLTNTHSVGTVRDTIIKWQAEQNAIFQRWATPVVAETADGWLSDINGFFVESHHVMDAIHNASSGPIAEGNVGGGTGMICYEFKGGTGTSSRKLPEKLGGFTVGALAQANFGRRYHLTIAGAPVGHHLTEDAFFTNAKNPLQAENGSLIVVLATDAPLLPHQLKRIARRAGVGMARTGALGGNGSGDIFIAFSTAPSGGTGSGSMKGSVEFVHNDFIDPIFYAAAYATEEAIINAMITAEDMTGRDNLTIKAIPHDALKNILQSYNRLKKNNPA